jgi:chorismate lyase/3-hydroxybenzoate synthase
MRPVGILKQPHVSSEPWLASGDAARDLPSWVQSVLRAGGAVSSVTLEADAVHDTALADLARDAFMRAVGGLPGAPCRAWSFLPRPTAVDGGSLERYMHFNAGRTAAFRAMTSRVSVIPAGTCVGHAGTRLVVHALHMPGTIMAIENPRQRPAWLYSERYGPVSPAFTRAAVVGGTLIASGTAAVVGEDSMHADSISAQCEETLRNLDALAEAGGARGPWRALQIYVRDAAAVPVVASWAQSSFPGEVERVLCASLCRSNLLVEIEGVADAA